MTVLIRFKTPGGKRRRCDSRCHNAKGAVCACICGGAYHGAGRDGTLPAKMVEHQDQTLRSLELQGTVLSAVLPFRELAYV